MTTTPAPSRTKVVLLGASYARGWSPTHPAIEFVNQGRDGQQSWELLERFDTDVIALAPRAVVVWGFINDIFRSKADAREAALVRVKQSMTEMIDRSVRAGIEPVVATEVPIRERAGWKERLSLLLGALAGKRSYQDRVNRDVEAVNAWLRTVAAERGLLLLDLHAVLAGAGGKRAPGFATADGSHISPAGYRAMSDRLVPLIADRLRGTRP